MSRIGNKVLPLPDKVTVSLEHAVVTVKGPKGELKQPISRNISMTEEEGNVSFVRPNNNRHNRAQHGLARTLVGNMIEGVTKGHSKTLEIHGVGYRASVAGNKLTLNIGYSHPVEIVAPEGISFELSKEERGKTSTITVSGIDKALVGQIAADIRKTRKPDPYKGKGLRYVGEIVRLRPGKRAGK